MAGLLCWLASPPAMARVSIANGTEDKLPIAWRSAHRLHCDHEINQRLVRDGNIARAKSTDMSGQGYGRLIDLDAGRMTLLIPSRDGFLMDIGTVSFEPEMRHLSLVLLSKGAVWLQMVIDVDTGRFSSVSLDPDEPVVVYGQCTIERG
ncbi:hypothetical protein [Inquilinus sp. CA228]|uniref:hypothetical protein n=1 Tax=Inquilinus sp. CA228 TaxID=3455609 RepID=UPI003F8D118C